MHYCSSAESTEDSQSLVASESVGGFIKTLISRLNPKSFSFNRERPKKLKFHQFLSDSDTVDLKLHF